MRIIHTSDWHLGRTLNNRKRYDEQSAFLNWLANYIEDEHVEALLIAGDVFDTTTPSNRAQELYYTFLCRIARSCCRNVVVIGGNHDSPSFLNAPKELLKALNVFVVGSITENPEDEVIVLRDIDNKPKVIVCAVPYLRDRDIRTVEAGETIEDKNAKLIEGIRNHYSKIFLIAEKKREELLKVMNNENGSSKTPIIAMGHLFTTGGKTVEDDGVRELYVGTLAHVGESVFPEGIDYIALGHLHIPQQVKNSEKIRYSGSPIPMGFGEGTKKLVLVELHEKMKTKEIEIPCFQELKRVCGSLAEIRDKINILKTEKSTAWLEIVYNGEEIVPNLRDIIEEFIEDSELEIRKIKNQRTIDEIKSKWEDSEVLDELDELEVFNKCLEVHNISEKERPELIQSYKEILTELHEKDIQAE